MHSNTTYSNRALAIIVAKGKMPPWIKSTCTTNNLRWWTPSTVHQVPAYPNNCRCNELPVREHHEKQQTWMGAGDLKNQRTWSPAARDLESHRTCTCGRTLRDDERDLLDATCMCLGYNRQENSLQQDRNHAWMKLSDIYIFTYVLSHKT